eukprot:s1571_g7.t1
MGLGRSCDGDVGRYDMETCRGGGKCDGHFKMSGDEYSCDKIKDGWMQSSLLIAISSPERCTQSWAGKIPERRRFQSQKNLHLQKEEEGKCEGVLLVSIASCGSCAASFHFGARLALRKSEEGEELYNRP